MQLRYYNVSSKEGSQTSSVPAKIDAWKGDMVRELAFPLADFSMQPNQAEKGRRDLVKSVCAATCDQNEAAK